jgi:hemolysin activation/secretion protein
MELPPIPPPAREDRLSAGLEVFVREFVIEGSTVFSPEELARITEPYTGRAITSEELLAASDAITDHYIERGFITSGALVPDQEVEDAVVRIQVEEGVLAEVTVEGTRWFRERYFRSRLLRAGRPPVSVKRLEDLLQRFQRDPRIERVQARLEPGAQLGESVLSLVVEEGRPYQLLASVSNDRPPAIGSTGGVFTLGLANLLGHTDEFTGFFELTEGIEDLELRYEFPVTPYDTRLGLQFRNSDLEVVEEPFEDFVFTEARTYGLRLAHPVLRTSNHDLWLALVGERRRSESCVVIFPPECDPFSFQPGTDDPEQVVSVLRFVQNWTWRRPRDVLAARSTASLGLDVLGATISSEPDAPDGEFFAWLGQVQWAHRFGKRLWGSQLVFRTDVQLASRPLLSLEKFAVGGLRTVRGYRRNELVRDNGVVASLELRIPLYRGPLGRDVVQLAPFADFGRAWDERDDFPDRTLASLGVGLRVSPFEWLYGELYWGGRLTKVSREIGEDDLQDEGIHFRVTVEPTALLPRWW